MYELRPTKSGIYKDVRGNKVYLTPNDVWKYGETTTKRYTNKYLENNSLEMHPILTGDVITIKVYEKYMIYSYYFKHGHLPPGNKIFR